VVFVRQAEARIPSGAKRSDNHLVSSNSMPFTKESVSSKVRQAFQGVTLGKGVGLFEADGIDDYADDTTLEDQGDTSR
jgi:hypothetical protein